jgi:hypothetical protein
MRPWCAFHDGYSKSCFRRPRRLNAASKSSIFTERGWNSLPSGRFSRRQLTEDGNVEITGSGSKGAGGHTSNAPD